MEKTQENIAFLLEIDIFSQLSEKELAVIIDKLREFDRLSGEILFNEGDEGNELFIVKDGMVVISIRLPDGMGKEIASFTRGTFFGEMSIFENAPRSATCTFREDSRLIGLHENDFFDLIDTHPEIATKIMYKMLNITAQRLKDTGEFLSDMVHWGEEARKRAITDELTGAYNRRFLDDAMGNYYEKAKNSQKPLSIVMVDLDYFRQINDEYGHDTGDKIILDVVRVFRRSLREKDILARYGGDEFTIIMPDTAIDEAFEIAEKIRGEVEILDTLKSLGGKITRISTSQGLAAFPESGNELKTIREKADKALYIAKEEGRNKVVTARDVKTTKNNEKKNE